MSELLFIYSKDGVIKCLTMQQSLDMEPFIKGQWKHTATIDPAKWIEVLVNNRNGLELIDEVKGASDV
jgi:hypothetical protein